MNALAQAVLRARITPRHQPARQIPISCPDEPTAVLVRHIEPDGQLGFLSAAPPPTEPTEPRIPTLAEVCRAVCEHWPISRVDLISQRRTKQCVLPRHVAMYLARTLTACSMPQIGRALGGRDHTTVLNGVRVIERKRARNAHLAKRIDDIAAILTRGTT
jgi:hypothetical protein